MLSAPPTLRGRQEVGHVSDYVTLCLISPRFQRCIAQSKSFSIPCLSGDRFTPPQPGGLC